MDTVRNDIMQINMDGVPEDLVFGLDIGTRSIVGSVGYKDEDGQFIVVAQSVIQHETRAMLDGQIHDVNKVSDTIRRVKERLEAMTGRTFQDACIAAAGRVLKTVDESAEVEFGTETVVTNEHVFSLDMLAVEKAHEILREQEGDEVRFYCVGYSVKQYYQNDFPISNLEGHKCVKVKTELIATFLPDEVVDGLYAAVERAGLYVANLTLEPIAAINVAIPERYRLLNIALVDVGAGTSDISITRDGSIIAYGMIPAAGDEITECLSRHYLVDFQEADRFKCAASSQEEVEFRDIMGMPQKVSSKEVAEVIRDTVQSITKSVADKIIELNGGKTVSAVFVVGGGGKALGFVDYLAEYLDVPKERVALRGLEVLGNVSFLQNDISVDSLLVTPIGICLNYYEQRNNFIFVHVNEERIRLYDNNRLTILDAALQVGIPNEVLFAQRGDAISYTVNGEQRMLRGEPGDPAIIRLNGTETGINTPIAQNDIIEVIPSQKGEQSVLEVGSLPEYKSQISYYVNGKLVTCPCFVSVNGELVSEYYEIQNGDRIEILNYYTLSQVLEFMDITTEGIAEVNHLPATADTRVYENFSVDIDIVTPPLQSERAFVTEITPVNEAVTEELGRENVSIQDTPEQVEPMIEETLPTEEPAIEETLPTEEPVAVETPFQTEVSQEEPVLEPIRRSHSPEMEEILPTEEPIVSEPVTPATPIASVPSATPVASSEAAVPVPTVASSEPIAPAPPATPSEPVAPAPPVASSEAVAPAPPVVSSEVVAPAPPVASSEAAAPAPSVTPSEPATSVPPVASSEPIAPAPPVASSEPVAPAPPVASSEAVAPAPSVTPSEPADPVPPVASSEAVAPAPSATPSEPTAPAPPVTPSEPVPAAPPALGTPNAPTVSEVAITVNGDPVILKGKQSYILVDILDFYPVDTAVAHGDRLEIKRNGLDGNFTDPIFAGDTVIIQWVTD